MFEIILASSSPRRKELLTLAGIPYHAISSDAEELKADGILTPQQIAMENAYRKANDIFSSNRDSVVLGADTIVSIGNTVLGKPKSRDEARNMLEMLAGKTHTVLTGIAVISKEKTVRDICETSVTFRPLSDQLIEKYLDTGEYRDKAGAYGIQGKGCILVESLSGDYFNVMGLPICKVYKILESF